MGLFKGLFGGAQPSARGHYEKGLEAEQRFDHRQALADFTDAIRLDRQCADAYYARGFLHEILGEFDPAIADFEKVIELAPSVGDNLVIDGSGDGRARVLRLEKEVTWGEGVIPNGPLLDIARVWCQRGIRCADTGDSETAIEHFSAALESSPFGDDPGQPWQPAHPACLYVERGRCHSRAGRFQEAIADLTKATNFGVLAQEDLREFRHHVYLLLGHCQLELENHDAAINALTQAIEDLPPSASAFAFRADAHHGKRNLAEALADVSEAIRLDPQNVRSYVSRSFIQADRQQFADAVADASEAIRLAPNDYASYVNRAAIHQHVEEYQKAIADYTAAIQLDPDNPLAYQGRARAYEALGDKDKAGQDDRSAQAVAHVAQAFAEMQAKRWDQAVGVLNQAIQLDPQLHRAYLRRGMAYLGKHEPDRTIADCTYVIDMLPRPTLNWGPVFGAHVDSYVNRGNAWLVKGEYANAGADYTEAIRLEPKLASAYDHRADAHRAMGEIKKAEADRQRAAALRQ